MNSEFQQIREAFAAESAEMLEEMEAALLDLDLLPAIADDFNRLFRAVHTIKGSAGIVSASHVEQFCHTLEHLLVRVREHELPLEPKLLALLLRCHDHIRALIAAFEAGSEEVPPANSQLLTQLGSWQSMATAPALVAIRPEAEQPFQSGDLSADEPAAAHKVVRVDAQKLDQLINLVVELVTASSELESHVRHLGDSATLESASTVSLLVKKIQERAMIFRMVPVGELFRRFQRLVHDLSASSGKKIVLATAGTETELDKVMAERLREPLVHLIRNAIDHGIEMPAERTVLGKAEAGNIRMNAFQETGSIVIEVRDDGRGIDRKRVLQKALEQGMVRPQDAATCDPLGFIFEPGLSTADEATLLSGRGVGMDVVKRTVEELRGSITVTSSEGHGTCFQIRLPLSLALIDGFMVAMGGDHFIIPMEQVDETVDLPPAAEQHLIQHGYLDLHGEALPCLDLRTVIQPPVPKPASRFVVVVRLHDRRVGLVVDHLAGEVKAVIKPLGRLYRSTRMISGVSILGDGAIAQILDLPELLQHYAHMSPVRVTS